MFSTTVLSRLIKDTHAFQSTSVYIHVIRCGRRELGIPSFLLTGHPSPLENIINIHLRMVKNVAHCLLHV